jgi:hypothetical protein
MSLTVKSTEDKKIFISGTELEIPEVYVRIRFLGDYDGKTIEGETTTFANHQCFVEGKVLYTDVPIGSFKATLATGEEQSIDTVHNYAKATYEQLGYEVIINI